MSLHVILLYPHGAQERGSTGSVYGLCCCRAVSAAVRPLCAVGLSGSCQAVTLAPDSDGTPRLSDSAVRLSDTCCQTVRESAVSAVRLSGTVRRCPGFAVRLSDQGSAGAERGAPGGMLNRPTPRRLRRSYRILATSYCPCPVLCEGALGALGVQVFAARPGLGSSEAHPVGRTIGIGLRAREP